MNLLPIVIISAALTAVCAASHLDRYNSIDVDDVISNKRLLVAYVKCVLDKGRCTPEGKQLKNNITEALQSGCVNCTDKQRRDIKRVIQHLIHEEQVYWDELVEMYDPQRTYSNMYEKELGSI